MGECPVLTSSFAAHFVSHFQATGLARPATASHDTYLRASSACKHYAAYDLENWKGMDRFHFNARITPQDWRDTYEPIFRSCVVDANVSGIMCSANVTATISPPSCLHSSEGTSGIVANRPSTAFHRAPMASF